MGGGGARWCSESSYIYERSEYKSAGGPGGAVSPREIFEFRTPESESERNLTNYFKLLSGKNYFCGGIINGVRCRREGKEGGAVARSWGGGGVRGPLPRFF